MVTALVIPHQRRRTKGELVRIKATDGQGRKPKTLPEYLDRSEVEALIACAGDDPRRRIFMMLQWRAGLRRSEACAITRADLFLTDAPPTLKVRSGKGKKARIVPVHPELHQVLSAFVWTNRNRQDESIVGITGTQAWRWVAAAKLEAERRGLIPPGRRIATHTLRHSAARYWLSNGVPLNVVSRWLGHSDLTTTLIYLQILPDPTGYMDKVP